MVKRCADPSCDPVEQFRGKMLADDFFDVMENDGAAAQSNRVPKSYHEHVEIDDSNASDVRIICRKCHRTTGWNRGDAPNMPGAGVLWLPLKWNADIDELLK
jgi:hypothetical protein